jgi:hypothetical protein
MEAERPSLVSAIPILSTGRFEDSVRFFERLGFSVRHNDGSYAIVHRDGVELHLARFEGLDPKENQHECRVRVRNIDALYESMPEDAVHPNGKLDVKPWGMKEFALLDPGGICVQFSEPVEQ